MTTNDRMTTDEKLEALRKEEDNWLAEHKAKVETLLKRGGDPSEGLKALESEQDRKVAEFKARLESILKEFSQDIGTDLDDIGRVTKKLEALRKTKKRWWQFWK